MVEGKCVTCHERPADHRCIQCHKPICDDCAFKDAYGVFCSRECSARHQSFRQEQAGARAKGGPVKALIKLIIVLALLAIVAGAVYVYGAKRGWFGEEEQDRVIEGQRRIEETVEERLGD